MQSEDLLLAASCILKNRIGVFLKKTATVQVKHSFYFPTTSTVIRTKLHKAQ